MLALWGGTGVAALQNILHVSPSSGVSRHSGRSIHERGDSPSLGVQDFTSMGGSFSRLSITKGNAEALGPAGGICKHTGCTHHCPALALPRATTVSAQR